ncbi:calretinin-like [Lampris incognitus]|uniref:calretinin-like n=1 Tax=Lampris incognitus TaxID=2546036 RepID=UPI0024B4B1FA|nr:calretinin-like [Lampris incognitus]
MTQQPPHLHLAEMTASQFLQIWNHYDSDGNGYIEGKELENFFQELEVARRGAGVVSDPTHAAFREKLKEFIASVDQNADGRIELAELAQILPTEENFLLCFRQFVGSSAEFMVAWRKYDTDRSGYIESNELKGFLSDLLKKANRQYDEKKLNEYTQTILKMFDLNGDGKLGLSEMARLLPVEENFLLKFQDIKIGAEQFNTLFTLFDQDGNGYIDEQELDALLKDLCKRNKMEPKPSELSGYKKSIMSLSDAGKLYRTELEIVLCRDSAL